MPEEVAVVGVDNEELVLPAAYPPLSSVIPRCAPGRNEAARTLDEMMKGQRVTELLRFIPPLSVATRKSSDVTAIANPCVANAMSFIREHSCHGIGVDVVLDHVAVSRSTLQRLFRQELGQTILEAITTTKIQRVKQLLAETDLPLAAIADLPAMHMRNISAQASGARPATHPTAIVANSELSRTAAMYETSRNC